MNYGDQNVAFLPAKLSDGGLQTNTYILFGKAIKKGNNNQCLAKEDNNKPKAYSSNDLCIAKPQQKKAHATSNHHGYGTSL
mmetsp:Transcript_2926/g.7638  ORF Transcript_2926/g.7638 Transcript_2926/m.7638 type:complete len:81 (+) Transcript_2926:155-397(+)|eukprot:84670-Pelagomonas_calceolata.AAC.2